MSTEADIVEKCVAFVTEQSAGEWDDKTIRQDAEKLAAFVRAERAAAARDMRERCAQIADLHNSICARNAKRPSISEHDEELWDSAAGEAHDIAVAIRATPLLATERDGDSDA